MADDKQSGSQARPTGAKAGPTGALGGLVKAESFMQLALAIPAGCFVGMLLGHLLDKHFGTHWIVVAGMLLGAAAGFVQIFQVAFRNSRDGTR